VCCDADARLYWGWRYVVEEVLGLCGGMEKKGEGFRSRAQYIRPSLVDSFVYSASGLSVVGADVSLRDERRPVQPKANPRVNPLTQDESGITVA
jgi:hypothetical protein